MFKRIILALVLCLWSVDSHGVLISDVGSLNATPAGGTFLEGETGVGVSEHFTITGMLSSILGTAYDTEAELVALFAGKQNLAAALTSISGLTETNGGLLYGTADNAYAWLAAGATTTMLVGGGPGAPVWTTATGTGAPVRADDPSFGNVTAVRIKCSAVAADNPAMGPGDVTLGNIGVIFEGANDDIEGELTWLPTTADRTIALPDADGTILLTDGAAGSLSGYSTGAQPVDADLTIYAGITPSQICRHF